MKLTCCTGERRNKEIIRRIQKTHEKYGKTVFRGTFKMDKNRMKPCKLIQRKHRHLIIINLLSVFPRAVYQYNDFRKLIQTSLSTQRNA